MADDFDAAASQVAIRALEEELIQASRNFEDAKRSGDFESAGYAMAAANEAQLKLDKLTGAGQPQPQGYIPAEVNLLSRRRAMGDDVDSPARMRDYEIGAAKALQAGWERGSPQYIKAIEMYVDNLGDGRQAPLNEHTAAELCGISPAEYAQNAEKLRWLKAKGYYQD